MVEVIDEFLGWLTGEESQSLAAHEARNLRRVFALWRRAGEESLTADDLG